MGSAAFYGLLGCASYLTFVNIVIAFIALFVPGITQTWIHTGIHLDATQSGALAGQTGFGEFQYDGTAGGDIICDKKVGYSIGLWASCAGLDKDADTNCKLAFKSFVSGQKSQNGNGGYFDDTGDDYGCHITNCADQPGDSDVNDGVNTPSGQGASPSAQGKTVSPWITPTYGGGTKGRCISQRGLFIAGLVFMMLAFYTGLGGFANKMAAHGAASLSGLAFIMFLADGSLLVDSYNDINNPPFVANFWTIQLGTVSVGGGQTLGGLFGAAGPGVIWHDWQMGFTNSWCWTGAIICMISSCLYAGAGAQADEMAEAAAEQNESDVNMGGEAAVAKI